MTLNNQCVAGMDIMQERDPARFKPTKLSATVNGKRVAICGWCEQTTAVKRDGFFVQHQSSQAADYPPQTHGRSGNPARVRRRGR